VVEEDERGRARTPATSTSADARFSALDGGAFDVLLFVGGDGARALWRDDDALRLVREAYAAKKKLAAIGAAALVLVIAEPELLSKKMTTTKDDSREAMRRKANYTGKDVESDGPMVTSTGFDRKVVRAFIKAVRRAATAPADSAARPND
jgi:putative intracellular protease/amidase